MKAILKGFIVTAMVSAASLSPAKADTFEFAIGEWPPHLGEKLPGYGPHAQKVTAAFEKAGHKVNFKFMKWKRAYELVKNGEMHASTSWGKTAEREGEVLYPKTPIFSTTSMVYYSKKKHPNGVGAHTFEELNAKGYKIVGVKGFWYEKALEKAGIKAKMVGESKAAWKIVSAGRADVIVSEPGVADAEIERYIGPDARADFGMEETPVRVLEMFPIFAKNAAEAAAIYDANMK